MAETDANTEELYEEMEPYLELYAQGMKGHGSMLGPAKKIMKATLREERLDKALATLPRLGLGAVGIKYVQAREANIPCAWKGQANLKSAQHLIHEHVEVSLGSGLEIGLKQSGNSRGAFSEKGRESAYTKGHRSGRGGRAVGGWWKRGLGAGLGTGIGASLQPRRGPFWSCGWASLPRPHFTAHRGRGKL